MTSVQERREEALEAPRQTDPERRTALIVLAILIASLVAVGLGWLVLRDSDDDTEAVADSTVEAVETDSTEEAVETDSTEEAVETDSTVEAVEADVEFPFGWFENRDSGLRIVILNENGTYTFNNRGFAFNGTYEVDGDLFTVQNEDLESAPGEYRWTYEEGTMQFEVIEDPMSRRAAFLSLPFVLTE